MDDFLYWLKIAYYYFFYPSLIRRPALYVPFGILTLEVALTTRKLYSHEDRRPHDCSMSYFDTLAACDRRTERRTAGAL